MTKRFLFPAIVLVVGLVVTASVRVQTAGGPIPECLQIYVHSDGTTFYACKPELKPTFTPTTTKKPTKTPTPAPTDTPIPAPTDTPVPTPTDTPVPVPTDTPVPVPTDTPSAPIEPYPTAPLCSDSGEAHNYSLFHTLWDSTRGCHYDHEHGEYPFTQAVADTFPGFDLFALLGNVGVGHTNPSSPMENVHKHGGMKWQVQPTTPRGCFMGFESAQYGVDAAVIQYHNFGDYSVEFEARIHSTVALLRQCVPGSTDYGYIYTVQHQEYGQRTVPYQGIVLPYPDTPDPAYNSGSGPYFTLDCFGTGIAGCRESRQFVLDRNANANSIWTSKPTGSGVRPDGSTLFKVLFRIRDNYQLLDSGDLEYPFTFSWLCSNDGGLAYSAIVGCRYNNSTSRVHEVAGTIPAEWDNLSGFDTDPRVGRITTEGFTTRFGQLNLACTEVGTDCHPIKLVGAYVGTYGTQLILDKINQFSPEAQPERAICFTNDGVFINCDQSGAIEAPWIGSQN